MLVGEELMTQKTEVLEKELQQEMWCIKWVDPKRQPEMV